MFCASQARSSLAMRSRAAVERAHRDRQVDVEQVHLGRRGNDDEAIDRAQRGGEAQRPRPPRRHAGEVRVEAHRGRRDERVQLHQRAAVAAAPDPGLGDEVLAAEQHRAGERADALVERHVDGVEQRGDVGVGPRRVRFARLPQPGAVHLQVNAARAGERRQRDEVVPRRQPAADLAGRQLDQQRGERSGHAARSAASKRPWRGSEQRDPQAVQVRVGALLVQLEVRRRVHRDVVDAGALDGDAQRDCCAIVPLGMKAAAGLPSSAATRASKPATSSPRP